MCIRDRLIAAQNEEIQAQQNLDTFTNETQRGVNAIGQEFCLLYTSPSPRDRTRSRMPSSA